jgi:hypothetical protein
MFCEWGWDGWYIRTVIRAAELDGMPVWRLFLYSGKGPSAFIDVM